MYRPTVPHRRPRSRGYRLIHEDADLLVVDKDPGILSVPIRGKNSANVQELLIDYLQPQKQMARAVHRIDRYTSGLIVFAKNKRARDHLVDQFRSHTPERVYLALVRGLPAEAEGTLRHRMELTRDGFRQRIVSQGGTQAVLHYRVQERLPHAALLEVRLDTGLKNQIRVQFAAAGLPLVGDRHYDARETRDPLGRQALHAWRLSFLHPKDDAPARFEAPVPQDFERAMRRLRQGEAGPREPRAGGGRQSQSRAKKKPARGSKPPSPRR